MDAVVDLLTPVLVEKQERKLRRMHSDTDGELAKSDGMVPEPPNLGMRMFPCILGCMVALPAAPTIAPRLD